MTERKGSSPEAGPDNGPDQGSAASAADPETRGVQVPDPIDSTGANPAAGVRYILAERLRQQRAAPEGEGYAAAHDDEHTGGDLVLAAACYAAQVAGIEIFRHGTDWAGHHFTDPWPWEMHHDKRLQSPADFDLLVKAGALIAAEIDRRLRALQAENTAPPPLPGVAAEDMPPLHATPDWWWPLSRGGDAGGGETPLEALDGWAEPYDPVELGASHLAPTRWAVLWLEADSDPDVDPEERVDLFDTETAARLFAAAKQAEPACDALADDESNGPDRGSGADAPKNQPKKET